MSYYADADLDENGKIDVEEFKKLVTCLVMHKKLAAGKLHLSNSLEASARAEMAY